MQRLTSKFQWQPQFEQGDEQWVRPDTKADGGYGKVDPVLHMFKDLLICVCCHYANSEYDFIAMVHSSFSTLRTKSLAEHAGNAVAGTCRPSASSKPWGAVERRANILLRS